MFLLPSYMAAAVKNRRWRLLPLTFAFAAGLALILVPITVGISLVAATISKYHTYFYWAGGLLMFALAAFSLSGRMWSMPRLLRAPDAARGDTASMFALGVFSGIASSCCAPVLAGVMTLSALSGSTVGATALGLAYVSVRGRRRRVGRPAVAPRPAPRGSPSTPRSTPPATASSNPAHRPGHPPASSGSACGRAPVHLPRCRRPT